MRDVFTCLHGGRQEVVIYLDQNKQPGRLTLKSSKTIFRSTFYAIYKDTTHI